MGFFDSKTKQTVNQTTNTLTETTQADQSGNSGLSLANIAGSVGLDLSSNLVDNSVTNVLDGGALNIAGNIAHESLGLAGSSVDAISRVNGNSLELFGGLIEGLIDTTKSTTRDALDMSGNALSLFSNFARSATADAVAGFGALAKQGAESTDDKVTKVAMYGLIAIAAIFVLPAIFKGSKA